MEVKANLKYIRVSPQKCRLVVDTIRGKKVSDALDILQYSKQKSSDIVKKVLESAIANAEHNNGADIDELKVKKQSSLMLGQHLRDLGQEQREALIEF